MGRDRYSGVDSRIDGPCGPRSRPPRDRADGGFTLIELVITVTILPLIVGAIALAFVEVLSLQGGVSNRISDTADAQVVSANFNQDVTSAVQLTTSAAAAQCGSGGVGNRALLGLEWNLNPLTGSYQTVVSYVSVQAGSAVSLWRRFCAAGPSATPSSASRISSDISSAQAAPTITSWSGSLLDALSPDPTAAAAAAGWTSAQPVTGVTFAITEPGSGYSYTLVGLPASTASGVHAAPAATNSSCGFATPGTGTYASTLCLVDFSAWNSQTGAPGATCTGGGLAMVAGVATTPYTLTLCLSVTSQAGGNPISGSTSSSTCQGVTGYNDICAVSVPTYTNPPTSEAFLGNNGFYTGVPGDPALYTAVQGSRTVITMTNITVLDANGKPATGWYLVTGDAESTDAGESSTWTSDQNLSLLPNSSLSPYGNACAAPTPTNYANVALTGLGTTTVQCAASVSSDKTGTVMLGAPQPTSLTVTMVGAGLEATFLGVLLP